MNTLFRACVYYCIALFVFTLAFNFVTVIGAFPIETSSGIQGINDDNLISQITDWSSGVGGIFLGFTALSLIGVVLLAWALHSMLPIAIYFFGLVFWGSFIMAWGVLTDIGFLVELQAFLFIFACVTAFLFIGAVIGMASGSG